MLTITDKGAEYRDNLSWSLDKTSENKRKYTDYVVLSIFSHYGDIDNEQEIFETFYRILGEAGIPRNRISSEQIEAIRLSIRRLFEARYLEQY